ncbi:MAG: hypothetical protein KGM47_04805, partial [Acidobacteriota bacterium]|nr:hypothetical protein [Acidobacteriota bacterium]
MKTKSHPSLSLILIPILILFLIPLEAGAQAVPGEIEPILQQILQPPQVVTYQLQHFLMKRVPELRTPASAADWTAESERIRHHLLQDVIFHGWPAAWVDSPPHFEDMGRIPSGKGYQLHKLRYEIVPGFYSTALLYEPDPLKGRIPAVLDVMGHFPKEGNKIEFEQKLCINQALKGMIALTPEWIGMGELQQKGNAHWFA